MEACAGGETALRAACRRALLLGLRPLVREPDFAYGGGGEWCGGSNGSNVSMQPYILTTHGPFNSACGERGSQCCVLGRTMVWWKGMSWR